MVQKNDTPPELIQDQKKAVAKVTEFVKGQIVKQADQGPAIDIVNDLVASQYYCDTKLETTGEKKSFEAARRIRKMEVALEEQRKEFKKPYLAQGRLIDEFFKPLIEKARAIRARFEGRGRGLEKVRVDEERRIARQEQKERDEAARIAEEEREAADERKRLAEQKIKDAEDADTKKEAEQEAAKAETDRRIADQEVRAVSAESYKAAAAPVSTQSIGAGSERRTLTGYKIVDRDKISQRYFILDDALIKSDLRKWDEGKGKGAPVEGIEPVYSTTRVYK